MQSVVLETAKYYKEPATLKSVALN